MIFAGPLFVKRNRVLQRPGPNSSHLRDMNILKDRQITVEILSQPHYNTRRNGLKNNTPHLRMTQDK
jgi:hypothetical protein